MDVCTPVFTAALFTAAKGGNDPDVHQETNGYRKRGVRIQWNIIQPLKRRETLTAAEVWVNHEHNLLGGTGQSQRTHTV